mgnify:CR=1 FL=1
MTSDEIALAFQAFCKTHGVTSYLLAFTGNEESFRVVSMAHPADMLAMIHGMHVTLYKGLLEEEMEDVALFMSPAMGEA